MNDLLRYLEVFQICDSTFPVGTFNHSYGMENFLSSHHIKKAPDFRMWLHDYYDSQFKYGEGLAIILCMQAYDEGMADDALRYDEILTCSMSARETRHGSELIADQMIKLMKSIYGDSIVGLDEYKKMIDMHKAFGNPAVVFSIFAHSRGISVHDAFLMYGYNVGSTLVQNAVRSIPLGQREGQSILHDLLLLLEDLYLSAYSLDETYLGSCAPGIEIAQMNHETQAARLFMS